MAPYFLASGPHGRWTECASRASNLVIWVDVMVTMWHRAVNNTADAAPAYLNHQIALTRDSITLREIDHDVNF